MKDLARSPRVSAAFCRLCSASVIFTSEAESSAFAKTYKPYGGTSY